jgi:acyl-CoA reductase-like NAD-dependent aldehyde dehydrogenase
MAEASKLTVTNPYSGENLETLGFSTREDVAHAFEKSQKTFFRWRTSPSWRRSEVLLAVASDLESRKSEFAQLMVQEAGKPLSYANGEVDRALGVLRWAAAEVQRFSGELLRLDTLKSGRDGFGIHTRFPLGVIFGITPFNFPLNLVMHKVVPAVASGCSIIIKPSPSTPLTAIKVAELFEKYEKGLVQCILADDALTESITRSKEIAMVSFTGSARVGKLVQQQACDKPVTLELGGNAWVIVMEDVPSSSYPAIAKRISGAAFGYAGQSCISVQNVAVAGALWKDFKNSLAQSTSSTCFGDPMSAQVISGPVISQTATQRIQTALKNGATKIEKVTSTLLEGSLQNGSGNLIAPTLLFTPDSGLPPEAISLRDEEVFAPVMLAGKFDKLDDLIAMINQSKYGLQAGVFTQNLGVIEKLYRELQVGGVVVNDVPTTRYDHQPYGGVKDSGHGREGIRYAMEEMTYSKFLALSSEIAH